MSYVLLVIDMQTGFESASGKRVRKNCIQEIKQARIDGASIVFLEYQSNGSTHFDLIEAAERDFHILEKNADDGSHEVERCVRRNKLPKNFKVCGINTDCCVLQTVWGLTARFPMSTIEVVSAACDSNWRHNKGLIDIKNIKGNVKVI